MPISCGTPQRTHPNLLGRREHLLSPPVENTALNQPLEFDAYDMEYIIETITIGRELRLASFIVLSILNSHEG